MLKKKEPDENVNFKSISFIKKKKKSETSDTQTSNYIKIFYLHNIGCHQQ